MDAPIGLAVSGGPDSLALLLLAAVALPVPFMAATVDHGLRSASAAEAGAVADFCAERGIDHTILTLNLAAGPAVQERAREARYAALGDWALANGLAALATAHHADDQAETLLMRLNRGAGVRGLASMRGVSVVPGRSRCALLRPLLGWRRSELAKIIADAGVVAVDDPSNRDPRFERARMRADIAGTPWLDSAALAASAGHLAEADAAIQWAAGQAYASASCTNEAVVWAPQDTPRAVALRVLERIAEALGARQLRGKAVARWYEQLAAGKVATLAGVRGDGRSTLWRFHKAPPPRGSSCFPERSP